jgi:hypothetical protein
MSDVEYIHQLDALNNPSIYEKVVSMINTYLDPKRVGVQVSGLAISNSSGFGFQSFVFTKCAIRLLSLTQAVSIPSMWISRVLEFEKWKPALSRVLFKVEGELNLRSITFACASSHLNRFSLYVGAAIANRNHDETNRIRHASQTNQSKRITS